MITVRLKGGLGNQMFQYAAGFAVAKRSGDELALDVSSYKKQSPKDTFRLFELDEFDLSFDTKVSPERNFIIDMMGKIKNKLFPTSPYGFYEHVFEQMELSGFFQNELYFLDIRDLILNEFRLKNESEAFRETRGFIRSKPSLAIHVRRGDYVTNKHANAYHGILSAGYYRKAYGFLSAELKSQFNVFVFADDVEWAQENLRFHPDTYVISGNGFSAAEEILLMSSCTHTILSNSTFSWWGGWLNQNPQKIVVAPQQWTAAGRKCEIIPPTWKRI